MEVPTNISLHQYRLAVSQVIWPDGRRFPNRLVTVSSPSSSLPLWQTPPFSVEGQAEDAGELRGETRHTLWWGGTLVVTPPELQFR